MYLTITFIPNIFHTLHTVITLLLITLSSAITFNELGRNNACSLIVDCGLCNRLLIIYCTKECAALNCNPYEGSKARKQNVGLVKENQINPKAVPDKTKLQSALSSKVRQK